MSLYWALKLDQGWFDVKDSKDLVLKSNSEAIFGSYYKLAGLGGSPWESKRKGPRANNMNMTPQQALGIDVCFLCTRSTCHT